MHNTPGHVGLFMLLEWAERFSDGSVAIREVASIYDDVYADKFSGFHLSEYMEKWRASLGVKVGGSYVDFTAPYLEGNDHTLSEVIKGKMALHRLLGELVRAVPQAFQEHDSCLREV